MGGEGTALQGVLAARIANVSLVALGCQLGRRTLGSQLGRRAVGVGWEGVNWDVAPWSRNWGVALCGGRGGVNWDVAP